MNDVILDRLKNYKIKNINDQREALREIIQEIALLGLWRSKFFEKAAFYGGSALRILYGLDRFSEDLDFTLLGTRNDFSLSHYNKAIINELSAYGFEVSIENCSKTKNSSIESAFIKANTQLHLIKIYSNFKVAKNELLQIKFEVDTEPALDFETETKQFLWPILFSIKSCNLPSLFAGKIHALLCRKRVTNIKGRDWYDFLWYIGRGIKIHTPYLESKLRQSGVWIGSKKLDLTSIREMLGKQIESLDIEAAKKDISRFVKDTRRLDAWTKEAFIRAVELCK